MILDGAQLATLRRLRANRDAWKNAKVDAAQRAKAIVADEISGYQTAMDLEIRHAVEAGIPKIRIREEGMGTKDSRTLEESLARTEALARAQVDRLESDPLAFRYSLTEQGDLKVTLDGDELAAALFAQDWATLETDDHAFFAVESRKDGSRYLQAVTPDFLPEFGKRHPVVAWLLQSKHEAEALAWLEESSSNPKRRSA